MKGIDVPVLASLYLLSPRSARAMNRGRVPGVVVSDELYNTVIKEWDNSRNGLKHAVERAAKLGVILKGMGYRGIHIGGIHRSFKTVGAILDRMEKIEDDWQDFVEEFRPEKRKEIQNSTQTWNRKIEKDRKGKKERQGKVEKDMKGKVDGDRKDEGRWKKAADSQGKRVKDHLFDHIPYRFLKTAHDIFFNKKSPLAPLYKSTADLFARNNKAWIVKRLLEDPFKKPLLSCRSCGDCAIQHLAFQCPESGCPKHTRNGACGGSRDGYCEVNKEKTCVWVRAWKRLKYTNKTEHLSEAFVPPRMWELNETSSWINFHLGKDHQR